MGILLGPDSFSQATLSNLWPPLEFICCLSEFIHTLSSPEMDHSRVTCYICFLCGNGWNFYSYYVEEERELGEAKVAIS